LLVVLHRARVRQLEQRAEERKRADEALATLRAELAHATRASSLATLTASIAHEVSQPLAGVVTNASTSLRMLANEPPNVDGARQAMRRLLRDGNRASDVVTRLRALFSRKPPAAEPVDLNDATREVIALSRSDLQGARATLGVELADGLPLVLGDRVQLQQVISNLLRNACDAVHGVTGRAREIVITTACDAEDRVLLSVRDSGVGFGPDGTDRLFDAFYTTKPDGMGIGLSVCRSIIENYRGRLWAVPNEGPGVTFAFSLPCGPARSLGPSGPAPIAALDVQ
jgi:C4-dicarboxylate-specific signal transduction histidine kinase